jgi:hypothetical protein
MTLVRVGKVQLTNNDNFKICRDVFTAKSTQFVSLWHLEWLGNLVLDSVFSSPINTEYRSTNEPGRGSDCGLGADFFRPIN